MCIRDRAKNNKAPGEDGIPVELFKTLPQTSSGRLADLFSRIWSTNSIPEDFNEVLVIPIYKGKGDRAECGNYRVISLLSTAAKILAKILLKRLQRVVDQWLPETQCGFRAARSTMDMIFGMRQLQEKCREQWQSLHLAFIDLEEAFDSINRDALWIVLEKVRCPDSCVDIVRLLHTNTMASVSISVAKTEEFPVRTGVKQECVLAPTLIAVYLSYVFDRAQQSSLEIDYRK